ncbi:MAG TPA: nitrilase-related carbon-nitrogen hydrolase [Humisphaera sp.]|nr:nitrilase-related carbon-nitrogen hydrolase [Humisphaera sp.]
MTRATTKNRFKPISPLTALLLALGAMAGYWFAFATTKGAAGILIALPCVFLLARLRSPRLAFYGGMGAGMAMYVPHLLFFRSVFGAAAFPLWLIAGLPIGIFLLIVHLTYRRLGMGWALFLTPVVWTGIEYFRSEVWYLRFAWLLPGQASAFLPGVRMMAIGVYGLGFVYAVAATFVISRGVMSRAIGVIATIILAALMYFPQRPASPTDAPLHVAGMQLEFPDAYTLPSAIERLALAHPDAQILVLSEYTFQGEPPPAVREMVRKHHRYLIVGGTRILHDGSFYNTAFVIGPDGHEVFSQDKSVPVQFVTDGIPASARHVWSSPWGKIGIAVCYDLSYARPMDDFVRQGAQGLIVPTMDLTVWGEYERRMLHGRMAPIRSAEYGIPTFGVWSSGVSQLTDRFGTVIATAGYPGQGEMISGPFDLQHTGRLPPDRLFAMCALVATAAVTAFLFVCSVRDRSKSKRRI